MKRMSDIQANGPRKMTRRDWLRLGTVGVAGLSGASILAAARRGGATSALAELGLQEVGHGEGYPTEEDLRMGVFGDHSPRDGFDPMAFLTDFDYGTVTRDASGRTVRDYEMVAVDTEIEVAPGVWFAAWAYNGQVPGPTLRCTEGDLLRIDFFNAGSHPHTVHFHGTHAPAMDGVTPVVAPGERFTYEFEATPFGVHPYHCHSIPLKRHIHKGLYGTLIVDPPEGRTPARELVLVMNGFDPCRGVGELADLIVHTHAKDGVRHDDGSRAEVPLGEGGVPWDDYIEALREIGYDGYHTIEREVGDDPVGDVTAAKQFLERY